MDHRQRCQTLRQYILTELIKDPSYPLRDDEPLITGGLIDSFALAHVGVFVEQTFGLYIPDIDLTVENLNTIEAMVAFIEQMLEER